MAPPPPAPPRKAPSYSVPVHQVNHRNLERGSANTINESLLLFDERMEEVAKDQDGVPSSFRECLDVALTLSHPEDYLKEHLGMFIQSLFRINHFKGNSTEHIKAETVLKKIRHVTFEFHFLLKKSGKRFDHDDDEMKEMYKNFVDRYGKILEDPGGDEVASQKVKPLYGAVVPDNPRQMVGDDTGGSLTVGVPSMDLKTVVDRLMMSDKRDDYGVLLMLVLTRLAVGRAGENKYLSYKVITYDEKFNVLLARWFMPKQLKLSLATFAMDFKHFQLCPFCAFAFFWMKGGLQRDSVDAESSYVFPTLRATHGGRCAFLETNAIRETITDEVEKKTYSSKSMRVSATSELQADTQVFPNETNAAGGWTEYTNMRFYTRQSLALLLAPARSLAGWYNPREKHFMPSFESLSVDEKSQVGLLLSQLYHPNEVPELLWRDGKAPKHQNFLLAVSATLLMRYPEIRDYNKYREGGGSPIIHRIIQVALKVWNFQDAKSADDRLQNLSEKIRAHFLQKMNGRHRELPDDRERTESLLTRLGDMVAAAQSATSRNTDDIVMLNHQVECLRNDIAQNTRAVEKMTNTLQILIEMQRNQPQPATNDNHTHTLQPTNFIESPGPIVEITAVAHTADEPIEPVVALEIAQPNALQRMMGRQVARSKGLIPSNSSGGSDEIVSDFLIGLYKGKKLLSVHDGNAMESLANYHSKKDERRKAKAALLLVDCLFLSPEERFRYTACQTDDDQEMKEAEKFFRDMNIRCKRATAYLEGQQEVSQKRGAKVLGVGNIIVKTRDQLELWKPSWVARDAALKQVPKLMLDVDCTPLNGETFAAFLGRFYERKKRKR